MRLKRSLRSVGPRSAAPLILIVMRLGSHPKAHAGYRKWGWWDHHLAYDHRLVPEILDVVCPKCAAEATASRPDPGGAYSVACLRCAYRAKEVPYNALPPLFFRVAARGHVLWAWNRVHLQFLRDYLNAPHLTEAKASPYSEYIRRDWLVRRRAFVKAIDRLLVSRNRSIQRGRAASRLRSFHLQL